MRYLIILSLTALLSGCAPSVVQRGAATSDAKLDGDSFIADDGATLQFRTWLPEDPARAVVIAVHGLLDLKAGLFKCLTSHDA